MFWSRCCATTVQMRELPLSQYAELEGFPGCSWPEWWLGGVIFRRDVSQVGRTSLDLVQGSTRSETWRPRLRHKTVILQLVADIQAQSKVLVRFAILWLS